MSLVWMDHDWCPLLHFISIPRGTGLAIKSESLEKKIQESYALEYIRNS